MTQKEIEEKLEEIFNKFCTVNCDNCHCLYLYHFIQVISEVLEFYLVPIAKDLAFKPKLINNNEIVYDKKTLEKITDNIYILSKLNLGD